MFQATAAMPVPLLVAAPIRLEVNVPCHELLSAPQSKNCPDAIVRFILCNPVSRIRRVGVAIVAIVGRLLVADHVVAWKQPAGELRMVGPHAGVDVGDDNAGGAGGHIPGGRRVDAGHYFPRRRAQIPLADDRSAAVADNRRTLRIQRIVGNGMTPHPPVDLRVFDIALLSQPRRQIRAADCGGRDDLRTFIECHGRR
jgi:hypothetical protein